LIPGSTTHPNEVSRMMRRVFLLSCVAATVQAAPRPIMHGDGQGPPQDLTVTDGYVAPPPGQLRDPRVHVIQLEHGYLSFAVAPGETTADADPGSFSVITTSGPQAGSLADQTPPAGMTETITTTTQVSSTVDDCLPARQALAQRLMKLRGVDMEPGASLVAITALEQAWSPFLALAAFGRPLPLLGDSFLANVASWDRETQDLTSDVAECLGLGASGR
jgi:hypothetical protein